MKIDKEDDEQWCENCGRRKECDEDNASYPDIHSRLFGNDCWCPVGALLILVKDEVET